MQPVTLTIRYQIAHVVIDKFPVNALNQSVRAGLADAAAQVAGNDDITGVVLSCAGRTFVSGANIRELGNPLPPYLPDVLAAIAGSPVPWVAALKGTTLGGGLELAMACHGRIADPASKMGLPEVTLGILPGSGGTVRLPRLVSMPLAMAMITGGKPIGAAQAQKAGLIDAVAHGNLVKKADPSMA
jgi:3-hydroxyacyl-CoA dehydrogenase